MDEIRKEFLKSENGRKWFINKLTEKTNPLSKVFILDLKDRVQESNTPYKFCKHCIKKTNIKNKHILIVSNLEWVECLLKQKIDLNKITLIIDSKVAYDIATKIYNLKNVYVYQNLNDIKDIIKKMKNKKFDVIFSNPPYEGTLHLDIISQLYHISDEILAIQPQNWALDTKGVYKNWDIFKNKINGKVKSLETFKANLEFNIPGNFHKIGITHIDKYHTGPINCNYYGDEYLATNFSEVTKFGSHWNNIKNCFVKQINSIPHQKLTDFILPKNYNINKSKIYCQIARILGTPSYDDFNERYDFYTLTTKNPKDCIGIRKPDLHTFEFNKLKEAENFVSYLATDFVRFCLAIYKIDQNVGKNEMKLIPWMDFTRKWTDEDLYKCFKIPQETIDYITNYLPDYFNLRGKK